MPKVSVIMPNFNHAPYLKERMDSILWQDYPDLEVILLDDASTDNSVSILNEYTNHPRVKTLVVNDTNSGNPFLQWQRGLQEATGEYVWIAESDDVAEPALVSQLVAALEREQAVLAFCHSQWIDREGRTIPRSKDSRWNRDFSMDGNAFVRHFLLGYTTICNASSVLFRRDAASHIDMTQVATFRASGDRLFWIQMALQGRIAYVSRTLNRFRQHPHNVSGSAENKGLNIVQDHTIYRLVSPSLALTSHEKRLICGYHWQAIHRPTVSAEGRQKALDAWRQEPPFGRWSYLLYLIHRAKEKC